jgi:hypothetical protein
MRIVVLSDNVLLGFARDRGLRDISPEIRRVHAALVKGGGGCRCRKKRGNLGAALASLKFAIAHNASLASRLKAHARANKLVVHVKQGKRIVRREV